MKKMRMWLAILPRIRSSSRSRLLFVVNDGEVVELAAGVDEPRVHRVGDPLHEPQRVGVPVGQREGVVFGRH